MNLQISMDELLRQTAPEARIVIPVALDGEKVYRIPQDVWETRCQICGHKNGPENIPVPLWAIHRPQYEKIIPCKIMAVLGDSLKERQGECMNFTPKFGTYGICESCRHNNCFYEGFCTKEDHGPQRRVYYGKNYGGDERKVDYWGRHRLSVCDDYEPNEYAREANK